MCFIYEIFALQDENSTNRPVCSFVKPLRAGRLLDTAREAARFVSLMHQERVPTVGGGGRTEQWTTMHAFLCRNKGVGDIRIDNTCIALEKTLFIPPTYKVCVDISFSLFHSSVHTFSRSGVVGWCEDVYLMSPGHPADIGFHLGKACCHCSR